MADYGHLEDTCVDPGPADCEGVARAGVVGEGLLEVGEDALGAVNGPGGQGFVVGFADEVFHWLVVANEGESGFCFYVLAPFFGG